MLCYVSSYFDIGRDKWDNYGRTFDTYLNHFRPYIKMMSSLNSRSHEMIVFIDESKYDILRSEIGDSHIKLVPINESYLKCHMPMWSRLEREKEILDSEEYRTKYHNRLDFPENNNPKYTLINHIKIDFVSHATSMSDASFFCWVDFGYFNNPSNIPNTLLDINKLDHNCINYTLINPLDSRDTNIEYTMIYAPERIGGFFFFGAKNVILEYQKLYHNIHKDLQSKNIVDDDQHIALRCYYEMPSLFKLHMLGGWHRALVYFQKPIYKKDIYILNE